MGTWPRWSAQHQGCSENQKISLCSFMVVSLACATPVGYGHHIPTLRLIHCEAGAVCHCFSSQSRVVTVAITDIPGRRTNGAAAGMSRRILTGIRCTTFTKLPVAFSGGNRLKTDPVPGLRLSIVPVNTWSG